MIAFPVKNSIPGNGWGMDGYSFAHIVLASCRRRCLRMASALAKSSQNANGEAVSRRKERSSRMSASLALW